MIYESLQILKEQLDNYFTDIGLSRTIELRNIALWENGREDDAKLSEKLILTLLRLEEETTLKNTPHVRVNETKTEYRNPPLHLNMFLLIAANFKNYDTSLISISKAIEFFQGKKVFTSANTVYNRDNVTSDVLDDFRFILEIYSPSFEELNNIWGTLGGRQLPSVIYKIQLIQIERDKKLAESEVITHIGGTLNDYF
ncbi:MAG: hypothetical protein A2W86_09165 [Bacteroidetes bacterium GWD2_45_23]|uniref:Pvc16 N-terminal domain-containing protein n=1 Tax=bioreactor metagenome TaxID=1076179 RepID=A0A645BI17_9ZZZZ|nr:MAG: hypothetical protein A2W87_11435 [Bacteroidetes bacterium GWC2_46_850]OFX71949.1 MAG: hypothetical protein A2071_04345 [Bacteroidetes bacterium GWC1_47_7]OFX83482.1 MAG: hypothetical protein A2W86_09165 [Bacteroidetes bacterium GWD2_45_23]HAR39350.1 DUF4255 domain-containing protein [Porphyromonadaceae bacterium]HBB02114.1 DUF4255 domain-containing protein [Porphyromonadaceae bacterium]